MQQRFKSKAIRLTYKHFYMPLLIHKRAVCKDSVQVKLFRTGKLSCAIAVAYDTRHPVDVTKLCSGVHNLLSFPLLTPPPPREGSNFTSLPRSANTHVCNYKRHDGGTRRLLLHRRGGLEFGTWNAVMRTFTPDEHSPDLIIVPTYTTAEIDL
jgi:hypothetical protein